MTAPLTLARDATRGATQGALARARPPAQDAAAKARAQAEDFEAVFVNAMFQHMFTGMDGEGPFGNGAGVGIWRSFLTEEYAKTFVKAGGVGIADQLYATLLAQQEIQPK